MIDHGEDADVFPFRCAHKPEVIPELLREQVERLEDREYLFRETSTGFELGIGRGGHGGGYWYCAVIEPDGDGSILRGRVVHRRWDGKETRLTPWDWIEGGCLIALFFPLVLAVWIYRLFRPEVTLEERFVEFMTDRMNCELLK